VWLPLLCDDGNFYSSFLLFALYSFVYSSSSLPPLRRYVEKDGAIHDCAEVGAEELQPSELPSAAEETDAGAAAPPTAPDQE
jgi:hypothetical protein